VLGAVSALSMLSPVGDVVKPSFYDLNTTESLRVVYFLQVLLT
jgi:hypothetical protein